MKKPQSESTDNKKSTRHTKRLTSQAIRTAATRAAFLEAYRKIGTIYVAAEATGIDSSTVHLWRNKDKKFEADFQQADKDFTDSLIGVAHHRAKSGMSDVLLMFTIKKRDPSFRENSQVTHQVNVDWQNIVSRALESKPGLSGAA